MEHVRRLPDPAIPGCTGADGRYAFSSLPASEYELVTRLPDQENETLWIGKVTVVAGETVTIKDRYVFKFDLRLAYPADKETISNTAPTLAWDAYPGASTYRVWVHRAVPNETVVSFDVVSSPQYAFKSALIAGEYTWSIDAQNASGTRIAGSAYSHFTVAP